MIYVGSFVLSPALGSSIAVNKEKDGFLVQKNKTNLIFLYRFVGAVELNKWLHRNYAIKMVKEYFRFTNIICNLTLHGFKCNASTVGDAVCCGACDCRCVGRYRLGNSSRHRTDCSVHWTRILPTVLQRLVIACFTEIMAVNICYVLSHETCFGGKFERRRHWILRNLISHEHRKVVDELMSWWHDVMWCIRRIE